MELARQIIATRSMDSEMQFFDATLPYYMQALEQAFTMTDLEREALPQILREEYLEALVIAREHGAETYARIFTEAELRQILAFYESDAGRRFLANQVEIGQDNILVQQAMNAAVLQHAAERLLSGRGSQPF